MKVKINNADEFKCDKCDKGINIEKYELYYLYSEEDQQFINCPHCQEEICVLIKKTYSFECIDVEDL